MHKIVLEAEQEVFFNFIDIFSIKHFYKEQAVNNAVDFFYSYMVLVINDL